MNYKVYQGTELKQTVTSKTAVINGLQPNKTYEFGVEPDNGQANLLPTYITNNDLIIDDSSNTSQGYACVTIYNNLIAGTVYTFSADVSVIGTATSIDVKPFDKLTTKQTIDDSYTTFPIVDGRISGLVKPTGSYTTLLVYAGNKGNTHGNKITLHNMSLKRGRVAPKVTKSVTTRGIRFNIPKTLTVGSNITLRYEEYPLGIVPIGNEPSGMFGGGNKQNLSAKVISTANGSSVVEVAGNVIEVGNRNLLIGTSEAQDYTVSGSGWSLGSRSSNGNNASIPCTPGASYTYSAIVKSTTYDCYPEIQFFDSGKNLLLNSTSIVGKDTGMRKITAVAPENVTFMGARMVLNSPSDSQTMVFNSEKLEPGSIATPYAAFVDGDTFTAQPDGTCTLFSEHKALYY